ncbi:hypothetical protein UG46_27245, partial [Pseudomonas fluorescens]
DLDSFTGDARVTCAPWPLIAAGQRVWLRAEGIAEDGSPHLITLYTASAVIHSEVSAGLSKALARSELVKLRDDSELKVVLQVTFDRTNVQANAVDFPLRTYTVVRGSLGVAFEDFETTPDQYVNQVGQHIETPSMMITLTEGATESVLTVYQFGDAPEKVHVTGRVFKAINGTDLGHTGNMRFRMDLKTPRTSVGFWYILWSVLRPTDGGVVYYDVDGIELAHHEFVDDDQDVWTERFAEVRNSPRPIARIDVVLRGRTGPLLYMDGFMWWS